MRTRTDGLPQRRTLHVRIGGEGRVGSFGTVAVPTLSSTEATLTQTEAGVGNALCHHGTGILLRVPMWRQVHRDATVDFFCWCFTVLSGGVVASGAARQGAVAGHRHNCSWSEEASFGVPGLGTKPHQTSKEMC